MGNMGNMGNMDDTVIGLRSVPELRPSAEEFVHPIRYLSQPEVAEMGEKYGILKVVPPAEWRPRFSLDWDTFKFHTRIQRLHELNLRNRSRACFVEGFNCFLLSLGEDPLETTEDLCLGVSDEFPLRPAQLRRTHLNGWMELKDGSRVHVHDIFISREYRRWFYRVHDTDKELLKRLTTYSKRLLSMLGLAEGSPSEAGAEPSSLAVPAEVSHTTLRRLMVSPAALLAQPANLKRLQRMKSRMAKSDGGSRKRRHISEQDPLTPPAEKPQQFKADGDTRATRTMRTTRTTPTTKPFFPLTPEIVSPEALDETCVVCHSSDSPETTLLCDGCSRAFHMRCLPVPLERVPKYDWFCGGCLAGSTGIYSDYGFEEEFENRFSLNEFRKYCQEWEIEFLQLLRSGELGAELKLKPEEIMNQLSETTIEKVFWYLTNGKMRIPSGLDSMKIRYGADIHSSVPGELSGFPSADNPRMQEEDREYIQSEWNLTRLPFAQGSLLEYVCGSMSGGSGEAGKEQISGMSIPWLYVGGPLSTFCWHKEDHYTLSANYSHLGAPKKWYGVPAKDCGAFEEIISGIAPEYEAKQRDLMHQLVSMVSPDELRRTSAAGQRRLEIYETVQRPGEFIITFPKVYHSGFNYGFNVNEAVNFTLPLWVPYSVSAVDEYERVSKECVFETFALLRKILADLATDAGCAQWMRDTGVTRQATDDVRRWVSDKYHGEVRRFLRALEAPGLADALRGMKRVSLREYLDERPAAGGASGPGDGGEDEDSDEDEDAEGDEVDDKLCTDCKTRVHFQWVLVDLYADCLAQLPGAGAADAPLPTAGLGIRHRDVESEWRAIIERAEEQQQQQDRGHGDRPGDGDRLRRSSRRIQTKRLRPAPPAADEKERRELRGSLLALRRENAFFGTCVFCVRCFGLELRRLGPAERARAVAAAVRVEEYTTAELRHAAELCTVAAAPPAQPM